MLFALDDLQRQLGDQTLDDARQLLADGCQIKPSVQRGGELITAVLQPADGAALRVYVKSHKSGGELDISGECSCDQRRNCRHIAAVLLHALGIGQTSTNETAKTSPRPGGRSSRPTPTAPSHRNTGTPAQQQLLYVLHPAAPPGTTAAVNTVTARPVRNGGYTAVNPYDCAWAARSTAPPRFMSADDLELLAALSALERDDGTDAPCLNHDSRLLDNIVNSGRCHLRDIHNPPLKPGPARALALQWQPDPHGYQHLQWSLQPEATILISTQPPRYIDANTHQCGPITTTIDGPTLTALLNYPAVAPETIADTQTELNRRFAEAALPPLRQLTVQHLPAAKPVPHLKLSSTPGGDDTIHRAELSFNYAGHLIGHDDPATRLQNGQVIKIQRDKTYEHNCIQQLRSLGFESPQMHTPAGEAPLKLAGGRQAWLDVLLHHAPRLRQQDWQIEYAPGFAFPLIHDEQWYGDVNHDRENEWFNVSLGVDVAGERINLLPALVSLLQERPDTLQHKQTNTADETVLLPLPDGRLLPLPHARLATISAALFELYDANALDDRQTLRMNRVQLTRLAELDATDLNLSQMTWRGNNDWRHLSERLRGIDHIAGVTPPQGLQATLRGYQQRGLDWLQFLREYGLAGILADDMGLGKTVQTLALLLMEKEQGRTQRPSLVIAPTSLMSNWRREAARFAPDLKVLTLHGPNRHRHFDTIKQHDLVLTTYALLPRDRQTLLAQRYHMLVLDEAQVIKNPKANVSVLVRQIAARHRLCLTGTPLENHLGELWSLYDFLLPGLLGTQKQFRRLFRTPIENENDRDAASLLTRRIRPFMLRRTKEAVATELPPKTEILHSVALDGPQRDLYETIRLAMHERVREEVSRKGIANSQIVILDALLKLRQVCCDPRLVKLDSARGITHSAKLEVLMTLLKEMIEEGRRILLFSQFTSMLALIEKCLHAAQIEYVKLTGQTRDRASPVESFQQGNIPLFLISLKAGGVGLNLTAADTVIHYDPWWNPAAERQATDRAHRIGQDTPVFVYKLISEGTVEEKIHAMQLRKQALADTLYGNNATAEPQWTERDLELLFEPLPL